MSLSDTDSLSSVSDTIEQVSTPDASSLSSTDIDYLTPIHVLDSRPTVDKDVIQTERVSAEAVSPNYEKIWGKERISSDAENGKPNYKNIIRKNRSSDENSKSGTYKNFVTKERFLTNVGHVASDHKSLTNELSSSDMQIVSSKLYEPLLRKGRSSNDRGGELEGYDELLCNRNQSKEEALHPKIDDNTVTSEQHSVASSGQTTKNCTVSPTSEDIQKLLTCSACKSVYNDPKLLSCMHCYCAKCIQTYRQGDVDYIICDYCRKWQSMPPGGTQDLTPCHTFIDLLKIVFEDRDLENEAQQCEACSRVRILEFFCTSCSAFICRSCHAAHAKLTITRNHSSLPVSLVTSKPQSLYAGKRDIICKIHSEPVSYMCESCGLFLCHAELTSGHSRHRIQVLSEVRKIVKRNAAELERKVKQNIRVSKSAKTFVTTCLETFQRKYTKTENAIDDAVRCVERNLHVTASKLKRQLQERRHSEENMVDDVLHHCVSVSGSSEHIRRMLLSVTRESNVFDTLALVSYCEQTFGSSKESTIAQNYLESELLFVPSEKVNMMKMADNLGEVKQLGSYPNIKKPMIVSTFDIISHISGMAFNKFGDFVCVSYQDQSCVMYDREGHVVRDLSKDVTRPWDVVFTHENTFLVTDCGDDTGLGSVKLFSPAGSYLGDIWNNVKSPAGIARDRSDRIYICDEHECSVKVLSTNGITLNEFKSWNKKYIFRGPIFIDVNFTNDVVVCDDHNTVVLLTSDGAVKTTYTVDERHDLLALCTDRHGHILVVDNLQGGLHILTADCKLRRFVNFDKNQSLGEMRCISVTPAGYLALADKTKLSLVDLFE